MNYLEGDARTINAEARKKYPHLHDDNKVVIDPLVEKIQNNEDMNLERIVHTANKLSYTLPTPVRLSGPRNRHRKLLFGVMLFISTLTIGIIIGSKRRL